MANALKLEKVDEEGKPIKCLAACASQKPRKAPKQKAETGAASEKGGSTDVDDDNYELPGLDAMSDSESDGEQSDAALSNAEVRHFTVYQCYLHHSDHGASIHSGCQYPPLKDCSSYMMATMQHHQKGSFKGQALNTFSGH